MAMKLGNAKCKFALGNDKVKRIYLGNVKVYSAGNIVTYHVDTGTVFSEEIDEGASCLSPKSFAPAKSGWTFVGWREDASAGSTVLTSKIMGDAPVTLYAVFRAAVTVTYYDNSTTAKSTSGYRYYNNGNAVNPSFALGQAVSSGWTPRGWSTTNKGDAAIAYANGATFTRDSNITLYGLYQQTITVTYYNNSTSASTTTGTRYWAPAGYINPSFTLTQSSRSGWTARGWSTSTAGNGSISYNNATAFTRDSNITLYGMYQQTITVTYYNNSTTASTTTGTRYYNSGSGAVVNPSFKLSQSALSGWTARGWSTGSSASAGISYNNGATFTRDSNITLYGMYYQTVTLTTRANGSSTAHNGTRYYCPGSGSVVNPTFTVANPSLSGAIFKGWSSSASSSSISNSSISNLSLSASTTRYAVFRYADSSATIPDPWYRSLPKDGAELTILTIDTTKYSAWSFMTHVEISFGNNTSGEVAFRVWIGSTLVRMCYSPNANDQTVRDYPGTSYPGAGSAKFTVTGTGNITAKVVASYPSLQGLLSYCSVFRESAVTLTGRTVIG